MDLTRVEKFVHDVIRWQLESLPNLWKGVPGLWKDEESKLFIDTTGAYIPDELPVPDYLYFGNYEIDRSITYALSHSLNIQSLTPDIVEILKFRVGTEVLRDSHVDERGVPHGPILSSQSLDVDTIEGNVVRVKIYVLYVKVNKKETGHDLQVFFFIAKKR